MKDLYYVYDKFENLILFLEAEVNGTYECDEVAEAKEALDTLYQIIENDGCSMSANLKVGDRVEILYYEEGHFDAPTECIGKVGEIIALENDQEAYIYLVKFDYKINSFQSWNFKPKQLKLV